MRSFGTLWQGMVCRKKESHYFVRLNLEVNGSCTLLHPRVSFCYNKLWFESINSTLIILVCRKVSFLSSTVVLYTTALFKRTLMCKFSSIKLLIWTLSLKLEYKWHSIRYWLNFTNNYAFMKLYGLKIAHIGLMPRRRFI